MKETPAMRVTNAQARESMWVEVIQQMEGLYAELATHQTELEAKNAELHAAYEFIENVLQSMSEVLVVTDARWLIRRTNRALLDLLGYAEAELAGRPFSVLFPEDAALQVRQVEKLVRAGDVQNAEADLRTKTGEVIPVALSGSALKDRFGKVTGMVAVARDLRAFKQAYAQLQRAHEELKATQAQLVQSEKLASLGQLVAGVAHELNNPVSFIYGNMESLRRYTQRMKAVLEAYVQAPLGNRAAAEEIERLKRQLKLDHIMGDLDRLVDGCEEGAERASEIVRELMVFSKSTAGARQEVDLHSLLDRTVRLLEHRWRERIAIHREYGELPTLLGSPGQLVQVFMNLLANAFDAVPERGEVWITTASAGPDRVCVTVRDNGTGIAPEHLGRIFDPFFTTKEVGKGMGLGLSLCYSIVRDHGGEISVTSTPGQGATFTVTLPAPST